MFPLRRSTRVRILAACLLGALGATLAVSSPPVRAQNAADAQEEAEPRVMLQYQQASMERLLADPKDRALRTALQMLPARLLELPREIPELRQVPRPVLELVSLLATRPLRLVVLDRGFDQEAGRPALAAGLRIDMPDEANALALRDAMLDLLEQAGPGMQVQPSQRHPTMSMVPTPVGPLAFGPRVSEAGEWTYDVLVGEIDDVDAHMEPPAAAPAGVELLGSGSLDLGALAPLTNMLGMFAMAGGQPAMQIMQSLSEAGLLGPNAMRFDAAFFREDGHATLRFAARGMGRFIDAYGQVKKPVTDEHLSAIPASAYTATMSSYDPGFLWRQMNEQAAAQPALAEGIAEVERRLGLDIETDLLQPLGETVGFYLSDATGGDSFLSGVGLVAVDQPQRLWGSIERLASMANDAIAESEMPAQYVRVALREGDDVNYASIRFQGIPIPLEPTVAISDGWLLGALTPQAAAAAVAQVRGRGDRGLPSNANFAESLVDAPGIRSTVGFFDTERYVRKGYSFTTLIGSAIAAAVRSPHDPGARDPGLLVPTYATLIEDVTPMVQVQWWDGDDLISESRLDSSAWVNIAAISGFYRDVAAVLGPIISAAVVQADKEREMQRLRERRQPQVLVDPPPAEPEGGARIAETASATALEPATAGGEGS